MSLSEYQLTDEETRVARYLLDNANHGYLVCSKSDLAKAVGLTTGKLNTRLKTLSIDRIIKVSKLKKGFKFTVNFLAFDDPSKVTTKSPDDSLNDFIDQYGYPTREAFLQMDRPEAHYRAYILAKLYEAYAFYFGLQLNTDQLRVIKALPSKFFGTTDYRYFVALEDWLETNQIDPRQYMSVIFGQAASNEVQFGHQVLPKISQLLSDGRKSMVTKAIQHDKYYHASRPTTVFGATYPLIGAWDLLYRDPLNPNIWGDYWQHSIDQVKRARNDNPWAASGDDLALEAYLKELDQAVGKLKLDDVHSWAITLFGQSEYLHQASGVMTDTTWIFLTSYQRYSTWSTPQVTQALATGKLDNLSDELNSRGEMIYSLFKVTSTISLFDQLSRELGCYFALEDVLSVFKQLPRDLDIIRLDDHYFLSMDKIRDKYEVQNG